ncbi:MAG TPA: GIDE domain-containing protein [bacterium]|nr:GIDE domain-containing protein [bacterium]
MTRLLPLFPALAAAGPAYASFSGNSHGGETLVYSVGLLLSGIFLFFWAIFQLRTKRLLQDIPLSTIRAMAPGLVEVRGTAVDWCPFQAPFTGQRCVYYEYSIQRKDKRDDNYIETVLKGDTHDSPFYLRDETGIVLVLPGGAEVIITHKYHFATDKFQDVPERVNTFLKTRGVSGQDLFTPHKQLIFTERCLPIHEELFVFGTCREASHRPAEPPEGAIRELCLAQGHRAKDVFLVADLTQRDLIYSFGRQTRMGLVMGLALIGGSLYWLLK